MSAWLSFLLNLVRSVWFWIVVVLGVGFFAYRSYVAHKDLAVVVERLKEEVNRVHQPDGSLAPAPVTEVCEVRSWSDLQDLTKDTVVQVISEIALFNLLEPYKSPEQGRMSGSGFFISEEGDLLTNAHVVNQAKAVFIQIPSLGKRRLEVDVIGIGHEYDLALVRLRPEARKEVEKVIGKIRFLQFGDSDKLSRSQEIMTLGYPLGQQSLKSTTGVISGYEAINGQHMIQISAPINPGNSGGPSLNRCGQVIGVNTAGMPSAEAQNINYIIASNDVKLFLAQLDKITTPGLKFLRRPFLGVLPNIATEELTKYLGNPQPGGLYVIAVYEGSPLCKSGVVPGDMIYEIDGHKIDVFGDLNVAWSEDKISYSDYISRLMPGDKVSLKVYRKGKEKNVTCLFDQTKLAPVRRIYPGYEPIDYELFGGMVIMQLSINHLPLLIQAAPELTKYLDFKNQMKPVLIITHVMPDSAVIRARSLGVGAVLSEVNGEPVGTLDDFRAALEKSFSNDLVTMKTSENVFTALPFRKILEEEKRLSANYFYHITDAVQALMKKAGIKPE